MTETDSNCAVSFAEFNAETVALSLMWEVHDKRMSAIVNGCVAALEALADHLDQRGVLSSADFAKSLLDTSREMKVDLRKKGEDPEKRVDVAMLETLACLWSGATKWREDRRRKS